MLSLLLQYPVVVIISILSIGLLVCTMVTAAQVETIRLIALVTSLLSLVVGLFAGLSFNKSLAGFQFLSRVNILPEYNLSFTVGIDGISLIFILLTLFIFPLCFLAA